MHGEERVGKIISPSSSHHRRAQIQGVCTPHPDDAPVSLSHLLSLILGRAGVPHLIAAASSHCARS
jgi:hypothetical protein